MEKKWLLSLVEELPSTVTSLAAARLMSELGQYGRNLPANLANKGSCLIVLAQLAHAVACSIWQPLAQASRSAPLGVRLAVLASAHCAACVADCRSRAPSLSWRQLGSCIVRASLYVAPVAPLLVVCGSAALLVSTSTLKVLRIQPTDLKWLIDLGALHLPFWFVHMRARKLVMWEPVLPISSAGKRARVHHSSAKRADETGACDQLRRQRLLHFTR
jgi:hypothetical protein